jgi:hypothetical protein
MKVWVHWLRTGEKISKRDMTVVAKEQQDDTIYEDE